MCSCFEKVQCKSLSKIFHQLYKLAHSLKKNVFRCICMATQASNLKYFCAFNTVYFLLFLLSYLLFFLFKEI